MYGSSGRVLSGSFGEWSLYGDMQPGLYGQVILNGILLISLVLDQSFRASMAHLVESQTYLR